MRIRPSLKKNRRGDQVTPFLTLGANGKITIPMEKSVSLLEL